mgnify:CR=1 FL=1
MTILAACILGVLVLALATCTLAVLAIEAASTDAELHVTQDFRRTIWEEREALRLLRARYARGEVTPEEYRRLAYELVEGEAA